MHFEINDLRDLFFVEPPCLSHNVVFNVCPIFHLSLHGADLRNELCVHHLEDRVFRRLGASFCDGVDAMPHVLGGTLQLLQGSLCDFETWDGLEREEIAQYQPKVVGEPTASDQNRVGATLAHDLLDHNWYPLLRHGDGREEVVAMREEVVAMRSLNSKWPEGVEVATENKPWGH